MAYADVNWAYKDPIILSKMTQMSENSIWTSEHKIEGLELVCTSTDTVKINGGRIEIDGNWLWRNKSGANITGLNLTAAEASAWYSNSGGEANLTAMYVVAFNDSGNSFICKFRTSAPAYSDTSSGTAIGGKRYDKSGTTWMRYIGCVWNEATGTIVKQDQRGNEIVFDTNFNLNDTTATCPTMIISNGNVGAWTTAVITMLPTLPNILPCLQYSHGNVHAYFKPGNSPATLGFYSPNWSVVGNFYLPANASKEIAYNDGGGSLDVFLHGYRWDR